MTELTENLIKRNKEDMNRINLLLMSLDKLNSKEVAGQIQKILIDEGLRLANQNKELSIYLKKEDVEKSLASNGDGK